MGHLVLTIDVEDWFYVNNMKEIFPFKAWEQCESRIHVGVDFLLNELGKRGMKATFFIVGYLAERFPQIVSSIVQEGHEIGAHSYVHRPISDMTPELFRQDLRLCRKALEPFLKEPLEGYRAPSFSITRQTWWALPILREEGFTFDSSIYPTHHPDYGIPDFPSYPHEVEGILEIPMTSLSWGKWMKIPLSGGGFFRLYPYPVYRQLLKKYSQDRDIICYFHPWEFDPCQPRVQGLPAFKKFRHYVGLRRNREKFIRLLDDFSFISMKKYRQLLAGRNRS